jgi:hypothetical protein
VAKDAMTRQGGRVFALAFDQLAPAQKIESGLDGALGESGLFRKGAQARRDRFPFHPGRLPIEIKVNEIRGRLPIVTDDVAHQDIEDVVVDGNALSETGHEFRADQLRFCSGRFFLGLVS